MPEGSAHKRVNHRCAVAMAPHTVVPTCCTREVLCARSSWGDARRCASAAAAGIPSGAKWSHAA
eukprot:361250-Chlamydomonas_euryale.AAC.19